MQPKTPWINHAIAKIEADFQRSSDTHLYRIPLPANEGIHLYIKDESSHPTGSLKHRLARSLFLYGLCNGDIVEGTTIVEASSGSTAISEAYFAQLLGLPFIAVMPRTTSQEKIEQIQFYDGKCHFTAAERIYQDASELAAAAGGHYMDQFTFAERATDWRGNNNIAESIYAQMSLETHPIPKWIVVGAGTGGTSATLGRYIRYQGYDTELCVADPSNSVFYDYFENGDKSLTCKQGSNIEGIGRPRVEPSFVRSVIDRMIKVPDAAAFATLQFLEKVLNRRCGGSTGTNVYAAFQLVSEMQQRGEAGSVVTMLCDSGDRYLNTYYNPAWLEENGFAAKMPGFTRLLEQYYESGKLVI